MSVTLDKWTDDEINFMVEVGGNAKANAIYEAFLPKAYRKPHPDSAQEERQNFIKYSIFLLSWNYHMVQFIRCSVYLANLPKKASVNSILL
jgi:hypothetical protein